MRNLYISVSEMLDKVSFDSIYKGFHRFSFALYDNNNVFLPNEVIPYDRRFLGNTCIEYNGDFIAIWKVNNPIIEDPETLASDMVHEMFHAFQRRNNENRYPSDLLMLDYPDHVENFTIKYCENQILASAYQIESIQEKTEFISRFISSRRYREGLIENYIEQEYRAETIEGMAEYAGCLALKQISDEKYVKKINGYIDILRTINGQFFNIRRMSYFTGTVFCLTLAQAGADFHHIIGTTEQPLFRLAAKNAAAVRPIINFDEAILSVELQRHLAEKKQQFNNFFSHSVEKTEINAFICGYDPMNMIKIDNDILCNHFVMLKSQDCDEPKFIQGPVIVNLRSGSTNKVISYIK